MNVSSNIKFKIAPTASVVLSLASAAYRDGISQTYFENIDHSEGIPLTQAALKAYQHTVSVAVFRKRFVRHLFARYATQFPVFQVCILGAGLDPLSLHLLERYDDKISYIFEVDRTFMEEKSDMYAKLVGSKHKVQLLTFDVTDTTALLDELKLLGLDPKIPTIFLMEGLIYYMSRDKLCSMLEALMTPDQQRLLIMEYSVPFEDIPEGDRAGCRNVIRSIEQGTGWPMHLYHRSDIKGLLDFMGCKILTTDSMKNMEEQLNGKNEIFHQDGEGLIEITSFYI